MAPRSYNLGRRAETSTATRRRILEATLELYQEVGFAATTMTAVAERADVARGTILHHFGSPEGLLDAALDLVLERDELPNERILEGLESRDDRIRAFIGAMIGFQERTAVWWPIFENEMQRPTLQKREADYWAAYEKFEAAALGPELVGDRRARATLTSLAHPATVGTFLWSFEQSGVDRSEARPFLAELAVIAIRLLAEEKGRKA